MQRQSFWSSTYQIESPVDQGLKFMHVNGVSPFGFIVLFCSVSTIFIICSLQMHQDANALQVAAAIWLFAGLMGVLSMHTNRRELMQLLKTVKPRKALLKNGEISGDTCWEIFESSRMESVANERFVWWTRYQNGLFTDQPAEVFIYPSNGVIAIEGKTDVVLVAVDAKRIIK